jgi:hypothetical protein
VYTDCCGTGLGEIERIPVCSNCYKERPPTGRLLSNADIKTLYRRAVHFNLTSREPVCLNEIVWEWVEDLCGEKGDFPDSVPHSIVNLWHEDVMSLINELAATFDT